MTDKVTMTALDTLHISNVHSDNLAEGDVFIVSEADAARLEKQGLAERGGSSAKAVNAERADSSRAETREDLDAERGESKAIVGAPANKAEVAAPDNKTISAATAGSSSRRAKARK